MQELLNTQNPHPFLRLAQTPLPPRPPSYGLLQELLGGRLDLLIADGQKHPERYDADTLDLFEALGSDPLRLQKMDPTEQQMLNRAVIDFAAFRPQAAPPAPKLQKARIPKVLEDDGETGEDEEVEEHGAGGVMSNYWWMNL